jgi:hypothetical protein
MLNLLGIKLNPIVSIAVGVLIIAIGLVTSRLLLCVAGTVMIVASASRGRRGPQADPHQPDDRSRQEDRR